MSSSPAAGAGLSLDPALLEIIVCPACHGDLTVDAEAAELVCSGCGLAYPVRDGIPVLLVDDARRPDTGPAEPTTPAAPVPPTTEQG